MVLLPSPSKEGTPMPYRWPDDTVFTPLELDVEGRSYLTYGRTRKDCPLNDKRGNW